MGFVEEASLEKFPEGLQCRSIVSLIWERVPDGGDCHTEGSVPKGIKVGARDRKETHST